MVVSCTEHCWWNLKRYLRAAQQQRAMRVQVPTDCPRNPRSGRGRDYQLPQGQRTSQNVARASLERAYTEQKATLENNDTLRMERPSDSLVKSLIAEGGIPPLNGSNTDADSDQSPVSPHLSM